MNSLRYFLLFFITVFALYHETLGNERRFAYTYETSVLPPGAKELEVWNTYRSGRSYFYKRLDQRIEYEVGVGKNLMSALYLNTTSKAADSNEETPGGTMSKSSSFSISNEWKLKLFDRIAHPVGIALYGEGTIGVDEYSIEGKLLFDKEFDHFLIALNLVGEREWEYEVDNGDVLLENEWESGINLGISYLFNNNLSAGIETSQKNIFVNGNIKHSAIFAGPVISYSSDFWWVTMSIMPQIKSFKGATTQNTRLDLHEFEKFQTRLLLSFHL